MRIQKAPTAAIILAIGLVTAGCGAKTTTPDTGNPAVEAKVETTAETVTDSISKPADEPEMGNGKDSQTSSKNETASQTEVEKDGMEPVYGKDIKDGVYALKVDSSSSMFRITECELMVKDGTMKAVMTMSGTGYLKLFMGTGAEALKSSEEDFIPYVENADGAHTFEVPVEALDMGIDCSAYSKNKEKWYDRILVFRSDSLPAGAFAEGSITTVESLNLEDGKYMVEVVLEGGSGKASVESPAVLRVEEGKAFATVIWSSSNYDYMKVNDEKYELTESDGNSTFEIPVQGFDWRMPVIADTIAMSEPHEINYILTFDSATLKKAE